MALFSLDQFYDFLKVKGLVIVIALVQIKFSLNYWKIRQLNNKYQKLATAKRQKIHHDCEQFSQHFKCELKLTIKDMLLNSSIKDIHKMYKQKETTVLQVLLFFIERTITIGVPSNFILETLFGQAILDAKEQDILLLENANIVDQYPLFGIPVSVKDIIMVKGTDTTFGLANRCFIPALHDGYEVMAIRRAKGIIFVKTSIPQLLMMPETHNTIVGRALNPLDKTRSTGGSSGGEAGMVASRCSVIGIGTDTAGSLRNPAGSCGLFTIRASSVRAHNHQMHLDNILVFSGFTQIKSIVGPIGKFCDDVIIEFNVLNQDFKVPALIGDPFYKAVPLDFQIINGNQKYKIGFVKSIALVPAALVNQRAVEEAAIRLQNQSHSCKELTLDVEFVNQSMKILYKLLLADSGLKAYRELMKGEYFIEEHQTFDRVTRVPKFLLKIYNIILKLKGDKRQKILVEALMEKWNATQFLEFCGIQQQLIQELFVFFDEHQIDALLLPVNAGVAFKHGQCQFGSLMLAYNFFMSIFNFPIGVAPITQVREDEQIYPEHYQDQLNKVIQENMIESIHLPVGIQIITKPYCEEVCLKLMKCLEDFFKKLKKQRNFYKHL
ncbi:hypothetical protein pb186bvf_009127 [Paramecium bursaria]